MYVLANIMAQSGKEDYFLGIYADRGENPEYIKILQN